MPRASIDVPPVVGCSPEPAPPAPDCVKPPPATVVGVVLAGGFVVVGVAAVVGVVALDVDDDAVDCGLTVDAVVPVVPVVLPVLPVVAVVEGRVVLDAARLVFVLPPRSPGLVMASAIPAPNTTMAAINKSEDFCFSGATS